MLKNGVQLAERDMSKQPLNAAELEDLIGDRDVTDFLNPRNELYRQRGMKDHPPSRREAIALMVKEPNLVRRPILKVGGKLLLGFDLGEYEEVK